MIHSQDMGGVKAYDLDDGDVRLSPHFTLSEFRCRDGSRVVLVHDGLVLLLEQIREHFGRPIKINSAFRTQRYNAIIGGVPKSRHIRGYAADISINGVPPDDVASFAEDIGAGGVGRYSTFTHVDVWGKDRRWSG
jgi:uncharacterized protein YcbK (DUF882 family)